MPSTMSLTYALAVFEPLTFLLPNIFFWRPLGFGGCYVQSQRGDTVFMGPILAYSL